MEGKQSGREAKWEGGGKERGEKVGGRNEERKEGGREEERKEGKKKGGREVSETGMTGGGPELGHRYIQPSHN